MKAWHWWFLVVIAVSGPWYGFVREPQWHRVTWIPFLGAEDKPQDILMNFLMWVPFGALFPRARRGLACVAAAVAVGVALSLAVEIPQLFFRLRDPSATDVLMALCGTAAGSVGAQAFHRRDAGGAPGRREARDGCCEQ
jgi:glycopeptide antibiotics resistance protein